MHRMRHTIPNHRQFLFPENSPLVVTRYFLVKTRPTIFPGDARYGLIVTKKTFKHAVDRNRAKRLVRVWLRENHELLHPDFDYVFIIRTGIAGVTKPVGVTAMKKALMQINNEIAK